MPSLCEFEVGKTHHYRFHARTLEFDSQFLIEIGSQHCENLTATKDGMAHASSYADTASFVSILLTIRIVET